LNKFSAVQTIVTDKGGETNLKVGGTNNLLTKRTKKCVPFRLCPFAEFSGRRFGPFKMRPCCSVADERLAENNGNEKDTYKSGNPTIVLRSV